MQNNLQRETKKLLIAHNFMNAGRAFFDIFMSVYIWKLTENLVLIATYNIVWGLVHTIAFSFFARFIKRGRMHFPRKLGLAGYGSVFLVIFFLRENAVNYIIPIAAFLGLSNALYWISYQVIRFDTTNLTNRANYRGMEIGLKTLVETIIPTLAGVIIALDLFNLGYAPLFLLGAIFFFISLMIGNVKCNTENRGKLHLKKTWTVVTKNKDIMKSMVSYFFSSFGRDGAISRLLLPLFIFDILRNELQLGGVLSFFALISVLASIIIGKYIKFKDFNRGLLFGGVTYTILLLLVVFYPVIPILVLFAISMKIIATLINIPRRVISENLASKMKNHEYHRIEYIVIREWFNVGLGRVGSFVVLLFVSGLSVEALKYAFLAIAAAAMIEVFIIRSIKTDISV